MTTGFSSNPELLKKLLDGIHEGRTALPEFQRDWRWDENRIIGLLASIAQGFPIGTVMTLQTGGDVRFKIRPIEGAPSFGNQTPAVLVLDGQQRLTSLYQVLRSGHVVATTDKRKKPIERWFYIDIAAAVDEEADFEEIIVTVDSSKRRIGFDRTVEVDVSTPEAEWAAGLFPLSIFFDVARRNEWQAGFMGHGEPSSIGKRVSLWNDFQQKILQAFELYQLPVIELDKSTSREAVCRVFEKVNTGGVPLDVFELVTASFAADEFDLRADWKLRQDTFAKNPYLADILGAVENTDFLQAVSLVTTFETRTARAAEGIAGERLPAVSCKRKDILRLDHDAYSSHADAVARGFVEAAQLLHQHHLFSARDLPYRTQLVPMAAVIALLGSQATTDTARQRISRWYWCGVFGELYGGAIETRFARDVQELVDWIKGSPIEPKTISDSNFAASRLLTLRTRNSAAYKGLHALLMNDGCLDFLEGKTIDIQTFTDGAIDIHHIFPQKWCDEKAIPKSRYDSIINKTPLSASTNRIIGGSAPSSYLGSLERRASIDVARMDELVRSHAIDPLLLRADDFDAFFSRRAAELVDRIEIATGRAVARDLEELAGGEADLIDYEAV